MNTDITFSRCEADSWQKLGFAKYHYLSQGFNKASKCFLFYWKGETAGFCSVLNHPFKNCPNGIRFHRVVVLPQFRNKSIGTTMCQFIASIFQNNGNVVYMTCRSDTLGDFFAKHSDWKATTNNQKIKRDSKCEGKKFKNRIRAICYCYKFIGNGISGYENLLLPISEMRKNNLLLKINNISDMNKNINNTKITQLTETVKGNNMKATAETVSPTPYRSIVDVIKEARNRPQKRMLFKEFWYEGQIAVLFSEEGLGKSVLAMQIANENSKIEKVLYIDRENSDDTLYNRYVDETGEYQFNHNIIYPPFEETNFTEVQEIIDYIIQQYNKYNVKIIIIDNISALTDRLESSAVMSNIMKALITLRELYGLSILIIAHSKKRNKKNPIENNDLAGSKKIAVLAEAVFAIGHRVSNKRELYLKQIKQRYKGEIYGSDNVITCHLEKRNSFLQLVEGSYAKEEDLLYKNKVEDKKAIIDVIFTMRNSGMSNRTIAKELKISEATVRNYMKTSMAN